MGKLKGNQFGVFTGKLGGVVGFYKDNQYLVRAYQPTVFNPKSSAQVMQRKVFKTVIKTLSPAWNDVTAKYGTYKGSAFSKMSKYGLSTLFAKTLGAITTDKGMLVKKWEPSMYDLIAKGYDNNLLNVYNPKSMKIVNKYTEASPSYMLVNLQGNINMSNQGTGYFGMDYLLPETLNMLYMRNDGRFENTIGIDGDVHFQEQRINPAGPKNLGFYQTVEQVGDGWKYVYKTGKAPFTCGEPETSMSEVYDINENGVKTPYLSTCFLVYGYSSAETANRITCISSAMITQKKE